MGPVAVGGTHDSHSFAGAFWHAAGFMVVASLVFVALFEAQA